MTLATSPHLHLDRLAPVPVWRFTVDDYHRLIASGVFGEDDPVELLEGWIVPKMPRGPRHDATIDLTSDALRSRLPPGWRLRGQSAVTTDDSEPEPDFAVVRGSARDYASRHPGPGDIALVVEVSDSSLGRDRGVKGTVYARAKIPVYWVVNVQASQVEVFTRPLDDLPEPAYADRQVYGLDEAVPLQVGVQPLGSIPVRDLVA